MELQVKLDFAEYLATKGFMQVLDRSGAYKHQINSAEKVISPAIILEAVVSSIPDAVAKLELPKVAQEHFAGLIDANNIASQDCDKEITAKKIQPTGYFGYKTEADKLAQKEENEVPVREWVMKDVVTLQQCMGMGMGLRVQHVTIRVYVMHMQKSTDISVTFGL